MQAAQERLKNRHFMVSDVPLATVRVNVYLIDIARCGWRSLTVPADAIGEPAKLKAAVDAVSMGHRLADVDPIQLLAHGEPAPPSLYGRTVPAVVEIRDEALANGWEVIGPDGWSVWVFRRRRGTYEHVRVYVSLLGSVIQASDDERRAPRTGKRAWVIECLRRPR